MRHVKAIISYCTLRDAFSGGCTTAPALARWIVEQGHDAEHVMDCGLLSASDRQIWEARMRFEAIIVTKDEDFAQRRAVTETGPSIVWVRLPNARRRDLVDWFGKAWSKILKASENGETIIEVV